MTKTALPLLLLLGSISVSHGAELRVPELPGAMATVRLVEANTRKQVLGFSGPEWATAYESVNLNDAAILELTPNTRIATAGGGDTCYLISVIASGQRRAEHCIQIVDQVDVQELADRIGASLADGTAISQGLTLTRAERDALDGSPNPPSAVNPIATAADIVAGVGIPEAPTDGVLYGRQSGAWSPMSEYSVDQYDLLARLNAGIGHPTGVTVSDLGEQTTPAAGDWLLGWSSAGVLRRFDVGDLLDAGGGGGTWGSIAGTLSDQDDLWTALGAKLESEADPTVAGAISGHADDPAAHHPPVTVSDTDTVDLALSDQSLSASVIAVPESAVTVHQGALSINEAQIADFGDYTTTAEAAAAAPVQSVNGETGTVVLAAADIGAEPAGLVAAPASASSACVAGQRAWDGIYTYLCVAPAEWIRWIAERIWQ